MNNEDLISKRWNYTRKELKNFEKWYKKQNKVTQDKIQDIFKSYDITYDMLYKNISKNDKDRLNRKIDEWKENNLFNGYFKFHVEELMKGNITYKDLIEILLYGVFIEERNNIDSQINNLFNNVALDCYNQGRLELNKKRKSILPEIILSSFALVLVDGYTWQNYIDALTLTNMQELMKQYTIDLQQGKDVNAYDNNIEQLLVKQRNRLISTKDGKYSGGLDKYVTALGNQALIEASGDSNQKVKFVSDLCENVTDMCSYMDGMVFNTKDRNIFKRPIGKTKKDLIIQDIDIMGLVVGINQPPITEHFHWCHSTLTYQTDKSASELREVIFRTIGTIEKQSENWFKSLPFEEQASIMQYLSSYSYKINEALYNNRNLDENQTTFLETFDKALEKAPVYKNIVHRSMQFDSQEHLNQILNIFNNKEKMGVWQSYMSTSKNIYDEGMNLQIIVKSLNGRDLSSLNNEGGGEILFKRGTKFKYIDFKQKKGKIYIELEEIDNDNV